MYCPECDKLIDTNEKQCPHCNALLLPDKPVSDKVDFVKVFESSDLGLTAIIKSILINADIEYLVRGEHMQSILGGQFSFAFGANIGKVEFFVHKDDNEIASELLTELNN
ncbi:MAG: DUF2007 domain-containing protein [Candidatus Cloacimonetes bacterium]|jgi:hypothetical protein|nr:DUF2007 domain-containing protein [Candidatus Cloacimonadota bacterium]